MASNQLIRQWTLLQEIAVSYRGKTMEELGRLLEVGKRTVRRDLEALEAAGFPVEKYRDGREVRYRLMRGHTPPQTPFDLSWALALYNATLLSPLFPNAAYHVLLESALVKLQNALPPQVRDYVGRMKVAFSHRSPTHHHPRLLAVLRFGALAEVLAPLRGAVRTSAWTRWRPRSRGSRRRSTRRWGSFGEQTAGRSQGPVRTGGRRGRCGAGASHPGAHRVGREADGLLPQTSR